MRGAGRPWFSGLKHKSGSLTESRGLRQILILNFPSTGSFGWGHLQKISESCPLADGRMDALTARAGHTGTPEGWGPWDARVDVTLRGRHACSQRPTPPRPGEEGLSSLPPQLQSFCTFKIMWQN